MRGISLLSILSFALLAIGCSGYKPDAIGSYNELITFGDRATVDSVKPALIDVWCRTIRTPQEEKLYRIICKKPEEFKHYKKYRNLLLIGRIGAYDPISRMVTEALDSAALEEARLGISYIFTKQDIWARGQLVIFLVSPDANLLSANLIHDRRELFRYLDQSVNERLSEWLYDKVQGMGEQFEIEDSLKKLFGYSIRIPRNFYIETLSDNFVWLRALSPDRWVFIWFTEKPPDSMSIKWWRETRDSLCALYYEGDIVVAGTEQLEQTEGLGDNPVYKIRSLWKNPHSLLGGPILSYILHDERTGRLYIIDCALFAAGTRKEPYLRHLQIIAESFRPVSE
ncbi:DUF4837 family protein [bacterium]|nr:DUF4837 family protein [bacterium]